jgi:zinc protease
MNTQGAAVKTSRLPALAVILALAAACGSSSPKTETPVAGAEPAADPGAATAEATTAEAVLDRYIEATGGEAAHRQITSMRTTGSFSIPKAGVEGKLEMVQAAPKSIHMRIEFPGIGKHESGISGDVVWEQSAMTGSRILEGEERARTILDATLTADVDWRQHYKAELAGAEEIDGRKLHKVVLTPIAGGTPRTRYYDAESGLLVRGQEVVKTQMGEVDSTSTYSDYREVGTSPRIKVPHKTEVTAMGQAQVITIDTIEINPSIPAERFAVPEAIEKLQSGE